MKLLSITAIGLTVLIMYVLCEVSNEPEFTAFEEAEINKAVEMILKERSE